jgi:UDP-2,3-diacylglucosamine pyrophosphatase LpxH
MSPVSHDTLILSDLHLGSELSRAHHARAMLAQHSFRRLILLGDIFSDLNFARLTRDHWKFLGLIRKLSNPKRNIEVVWVEGNHDRGLSAVMSHLVGVRVYQEYAWDFAGKRHLAIHGHQFDRFVSRNLVLSSVGTLLHLNLQKLDFKGKYVSRLADRLNTRWLRLSHKVASGAILHARFRQAHRVFCGHTHRAMQSVRDGVEYFNSGSWTDKSATYITVGEGGVRIHEFGKPADDRDSSQKRSCADTRTAGSAVEPGLPAHPGYAGVGS